MRKIILLLTLFLCFDVRAKDDPKYPVSAIPADLTENVNAVFRVDEAVFKITSQSRATYYARTVVTIMNPNGKSYARKVIGYDKLSKISFFKGVVYDADGAVIKKLKPSDIYDQSAYDGFSLYSDNRMKGADLTQGTYPYTVEFEYETDFKFLFYIPGFSVISEEKTSVEHSSYKIIYPKGLEPRYGSVNIDIEPRVEKLEDNHESVTWIFNNIKPIKFEPYGPSENELIPQIFAAPTKFEYDGYVGMMDSWNKFGQWIATLNKGRNLLPEETKRRVKELTANLKTDEEKIKAVYEYMQNRTRYVSIQMGIGGLQPFEASVVDQTGYGDCKALSNYMVAMLSEIGIKANYTLIRAGADADAMNTRFTSSQFNHAVVSVPNGRDTIWLECTSQTNPFGYMGKFTGDRLALAITDDGAAIVKTPVYKAHDNVQSRTAEVIVDATGDAKAKIHTIYSGLQYENGKLHFLLNDQGDDQRKWVQKNTQIPTFDINSFSMKNIKNKMPSAIVDLDLTLRRLATVSGKRMFITPNLMNRSTFVPEKVENRKTKVVMDFPYIDMDTIRYRIPEGIYPEFLPEPVTIKSRFGEYEARFTVSDKGIMYVRRVKMNKGEFPADSYTELIDFYRNISRADNTKLVFLNKT